MRLLTQLWNKMYKLEIDTDLLYEHVRAAFLDIRDRASKDPALAERIHAGASEASAPKSFQLFNPKTKQPSDVGLALVDMMRTPDRH
jgi:hypothetical protein